jgi:hypothetical protein
MATMDDGIAQQLATEAAMDIDSDAVESSTSVPRLDSAQMPLSDSGEDEAPPAMVDPPENEPPVYLHPGGPPPSPPPRKISWLLLSVGVLVAFVAVLIVAAALDSLPSFSSLSNTTILGGGALLACSNFSRRRFALENFSPWIVVLGLVLVLFGVCQGQPQTLELQAPNGPPLALTNGFAPFHPSPLVSPVVHDLLCTESSAFMLSHGHMAAAGDPSKFSTKWCNDGGANRSISNDITDFTSNYRAVSINITVAKQNISMQAVGIGDCLVHCADNLGRPCKHLLKDVLRVPAASQNLMSASAMAQQGYQTVLPSAKAIFPPGLYLPRRSLEQNSLQQSCYIPFETINGLYYISTRHDTGPDPPHTRANEVIIFSRKLGHCPLQTLWETRKVVTGLESLADSHFPRNYISGDVLIGKSKTADQPPSTGTVPSRPNEVWHVDTVGPTKTVSVHGYRYNTTFTCGFSGYVLSYGHASPSQFPDLQARWYADIARFREIHGDPRVLRLDNAPVHVSRRSENFRVLHGIRTERICPGESHQLGQAERMNGTLFSGARTALLASDLEHCWWHHAVMFQTALQNVKYSSLTRSSPHVLMSGSKPDVSHFQEFGCEAWLHRRVDQQPGRDGKFDPRGEHVIFVGYPTHQQGYLVWCPGRGPTKIVASNNLVFGTRCPRSTRSPVELHGDAHTEIPLSAVPAALTLQEVHSACDLHIVGTFEGNFVLSDSNLTGLRTLRPASLPRVLYYTHKHNLSSVHLSLVDSYQLYQATMPADVFPQEVKSRTTRIPKNVTEALPPSFVDKWGQAIDRENAGFQKYNCFQPVPSLPSGARTLPGLWVFTHKRDNSAKARFCVGGHRQLIGRDYFPDKTYCAVLSSRDNRILLALAAVEGWSIYQTDIVQAFLHGQLDDVDIYINPPARYPCPVGWVLKLLRAIYGLHQAPVKFKQEVIVWFKANAYTPANEAQTIWIKRDKNRVLIHAIYADDFLHFSNDKVMYQDFQKQFKKRFEVKTGSVGVYLGNQIKVDDAKLTVELNQSDYIDELLERFEMTDCTEASTPLVNRLSAQDSGAKLSASEHERYRNMVGSLLYLACWSRPDISLAVSELSRFVSCPGEKHMIAVKHLLRYLKGSRELGLKYSKPGNSGPMDRSNKLWGFVDSDWAGCPDSRRCPIRLCPNAQWSYYLVEV